MGFQNDSMIRNQKTRGATLIRPYGRAFLDPITSVDSDAVLASQLINCALGGPLWRLATAGSQHPELSVSVFVAFTPASTV